MNRGIEISVRGMEALALKQDVIANNLANANTPGFRSDCLVFKSFASVFSKALGETKGGFEVEANSVSDEQGALIQTGSAFDLGLRGDGFFTVQTKDGPRYTRDGKFTVNGNGQLVSESGWEVMGENGPIEITGADCIINSAGDILVDGVKVNSLSVVDFAKPYQLKRAGDNLFDAAGQSPQNMPEETEIIQGSFEASGVKPVKEMVRMIEMLKAFEANQKMILAQDEMLRKAVNEVGRTTR